MPSHLSHQLFVEAVLRETDISGPLHPAVSPYLVLGAQGPDIFYHNQRRKPSSLLYGPLMHRHGYGDVCAGMFLHAAPESADRQSWQFAYVMGFASHAILDRHTHPFINYWSGWRVPHDEQTEHLRGMHPFLERLIDAEVLARHRNCEPKAFGFYSQVQCGSEPPEPLVELLAGGLQHAYARARRDAVLHQRMRSAYLDTMGFYSWTDAVDLDFLRRGLDREREEGASPRWLSIVHPPFVPRDLDVMNTAERRWTHPCSAREERRESFWELFENARTEMEDVAKRISAAWEPVGSPRELSERSTAIAAAVGNANLSDGRPTERPCQKRHSDPLPLYELQQEIRRIIADG